MFYDQSNLTAMEMMGMESEYIQTQCILADGSDRFGVCALTFDQSEELLWMGNEGGHVTSYYTGALQKYTSFQVHANEDIRQLTTIDEGILALTSTSLRFQMRRGIPILTHQSENMNEMQCMLHLPRDRLLLGGHHERLIEYNMEMCKEIRIIDVGESGCVMLRPHNRFICAGNPLGRIDLRDPTTLNVEHTLETHSGSLSDFDVQGTLLVTCGFSNRHGSLQVDRFLMVYDLRMMRAISPMQTVLDPLYLRFLPSPSQRLAVVSAMGHAQILDTIALEQPRMCLLQMENPVPGAMCFCFDISSTDQALAMGDNSGSIHLFSNTPQPIFNSYSRMTEHGDPLVSYPYFDIDDYETPLSIIPMPLVVPEVGLASDWPEELTRKVYRKPIGIDHEILRTMTMKGPFGYAPNPKTTKRNQVMYELDNTPRKQRTKNESPHQHMNSSKSDDNTNFIAIPKRYRKIDVKYNNKLGIEDQHYDQFNRTGLTGLEATLPNAYCNCMLQVLYYIEPLRAALLSHLCTKEFCLSCELGFLFYMLDTSKNVPCQPGNFLRAFRTVPEVSALGLIVNDAPGGDVKNKNDLAALIQSWNRFIIHQMHVELSEHRKKNPDLESLKGFESEIEELIGTRTKQINTCMKCKYETRKDSVSLSYNLVYPIDDNGKIDEWTFCQILARSLSCEQTIPAWCEECKKFVPTHQIKEFVDLPQLLSINTGLESRTNKHFWQTQMDNLVAKVAQNDTSSTSSASSTPLQILPSKLCRYGDACTRPGCRFRHTMEQIPSPAPNNPYCSNNWLPHTIDIALKTDGRLAINETCINAIDVIIRKKYELTAVVCYVDHQSIDRKNLVALIKVPDSYLPENAKNFEHKWFLFNDIGIYPVSEQEAVWFSLDWKVPCVLYYSTNDVIDAKSLIRQPFSKTVFTEASLSKTNSRMTFTPLADDEFPDAGNLIAIDAEFVTLNQEEAELTRDGRMSTVKPSQLSVARITCIRGYGKLEGVAFIDDYILTQEQVVDYLTKFSGIKPGDLDANFSSKHLSTLKSTYSKLRLLQDSGVIFVGHGLKNDFRVINLVVPPEQVADTVLLFHLPHHRMVSLRFLAWHFLGIKIQSETHDSVEDARTALQLYKKYKQLEADSRVGEALRELYDQGKIYNWKVPDD